MVKESHESCQDGAGRHGAAAGVTCLSSPGTVRDHSHTRPGRPGARCDVRRRRVAGGRGTGVAYTAITARGWTAGSVTHFTSSAVAMAAPSGPDLARVAEDQLRHDGDPGFRRT